MPAGKVKLMPSVNFQPPTFTVLVPLFFNSMYSSSELPLGGAYIISLITMSFA